MDFNTFLKEFTELSEAIFLDRNESKPHAKANVWCDNCVSDIKEGKYSPESVIRAMKRLKTSEKSFLTLQDLINEIKEEKFLEIG